VASYGDSNSVVLVVFMSSHRVLRQVLAIIGDNFEPAESDDIRGIALAVRSREYRIALWTGTAEDQELQEAIGYVSDVLYFLFLELD